MIFRDYKENFEIDKKKSSISSNNIQSNFNISNSNSSRELNKKDEILFEMYTLIIGYFIIILFGVGFHKYFYKIIPTQIFMLSIFFVVLFPLFIFSYYILFEIQLIRKGISEEELLMESNAELEREEKIAGIIPIILFGIGVIFSNVQKVAQKTHNTKQTAVLKMVAPYLVFSLLFGTVVPNIVSYLVFDHHDFHRVLVASHVDFISVSLSFGLMITSLLMPFLTIYP